MTWDHGHQMKTRTVRHADGSLYQTQTIARNPLGQPVSRVQSAPAVQQIYAYDPAHRLWEETETRNGGVAKARGTASATLPASGRQPSPPPPSRTAANAILRSYT